MEWPSLQLILTMIWQMATAPVVTLAVGGTTPAPVENCLVYGDLWQLDQSTMVYGGAAITTYNMLP